MALQSQAWALATPMPVAESSLYRQRLEVIAEKQQLQEQIRAARRELEEEKLRVQRLKRKSLRERWLMDGAAEGPDQPGDPAAQDPQSPEGQAQTRIRNLEDSLFTLQSQLQLLQSASTGAQHRSPGRPSWRKQGHRPLSQPVMEAVSAGQVDVDKRASLPVGPMGLSPESHSESRKGVPRQVPGAGESPQEANGPCSGHSPPLQQRRSPGAGTTAEGGMVKARGVDVVEVVWEGFRGPQDGAMGATGPELEARVEQVVLEAIGDRQGPGSPELPAWVRQDRGIVEVVWEGLGGSEPEALEEVGNGDPGLQERLGGTGSSTGEPDRQGRPGGDEGSFIWVERVTVSEDWEELLMEGLEGPLGGGREAVKGLPGTDGGGGGDAWAEEKRKVDGPAEAGEKGAEERQGTEWGGVERLPEGTRTGKRASSELERIAGEQGEKKDVDGSLKAERGHREKPGVEMEETLGADEERTGERAKEKAEELAGPESAGEERSLGAERRVGEEQGAGGLGEEKPLGVEEKGGNEKPGVTEELLATERPGGEELSEAERTGGEGPVVTKRKEGEELLGAERTGDEKPLVTETTGCEELSEAERTGDEKPLVTEMTEGEELVVTETTGSEEPVVTKKKEGEELSEAERTEGEEPVVTKRKEGEEPLGAEGTPGGCDLHSGTEQREAGEGRESQGEEGSEAGAPLGATQELPPELEAPEKQEDSPEEEGGAPQPPAEAQGPPGDATPLLTEIPAPDQPTESQPLLLQEGPSPNPSAHPAPTYAPTRQPEPTARTEAEEAGGPKQKTCQCCAVM